MKYTREFSSPLGVLTFASDGKNLTGLWIQGQDYFPEVIEKMERKDDLPIFIETISWLNRYFKGDDPGKIPSVAPEGTEFRKIVWEELMKIPYGELTSYGNIAKQISKNQNGKFVSARAVGGAVGHNPISIIIPCHRVIGSNGDLTGYAGGLDIKVKLLESEGIDVSEI